MQKKQEENDHGKYPFLYFSAGAGVFGFMDGRDHTGEGGISRKVGIHIVSAGRKYCNDLGFCLHPLAEFKTGCGPGPKLTEQTDALPIPAK